MIIQTTPEIAEGLFEHLQLMGVHSFRIRVEKHKVISLNTKVYFIITNISEEIQNKLSNLIELYNQLIPSQRTSLASEDELRDTQDFWTPVKDFSVYLPSKDNSENDINEVNPNLYRLQTKIGFGIGLHPSTILALRAIEKRLLKKIKTFVDVGSGSGILSLYAATKGCPKIIAFETQDAAIFTMKENFYLNNIDPKVISFNPYITKQQKAEEIKDPKQILNTTSEIIFSEQDFSDALFGANMRPSELMMCKDILSFGKNIIISGLMENEENPITDKFENHLTFGEWKCDY